MTTPLISAANETLWKFLPFSSLL